MFAKTIIDSDAFLDMPQSTQLLYFHLSMRADDDGFINNPKSIMRNTKCNEDDLKLLAIKKFIIPFESGVVVIKHWKIHNYIRNDRYRATKYIKEKNSLSLDENNSYTANGIPYDNQMDTSGIPYDNQMDTSGIPYDNQMDTSGIPYDNQMDTSGIPYDNQMDTQDRLGKDRLGKDSINIECIDVPGINAETTHTPKKPTKHKYGEYHHVLLTDDEHEKLISEYSQDMTDKSIKFLDEYIEMKGYKAKSHYLCIRKWVVNAVKEREAKSLQQQRISNSANNNARNTNNSNNTNNNFSQRKYDVLELEKQLLEVNKIKRGDTGNES